MADLKMRLGLQDNISPTLNKVEKQTIANLKAFQSLEKDTLELEKVLEKLQDEGLSNSEMFKNLSNIIEKNTDVMAGYVTGANNANMANEETSSSTSKLGQAMLALNQTLEVAQKGWDLVKKAVQQAYEWMDKYTVQFNAEFTAGVKMHNILGASDNEIKSMYEYASALQKVGVVGDETIISAMAELSTYARTTDQVKKLIPQVLNLAVANKGLDVSTSDVTGAAGTLGRALNGQARMLKKQLGLTQAEVDAIDNLNDRTEKANMLVELLSARFGDANEILAETAGGGLLQTRNALADLEELLGEKIQPYIAEFERVFYQLVQPAVDWLINNLDTLLPILLGTAAVLGVIVATIAIINFGPIIAFVGVIWLVIYAITQWMKKQDELTGQTHSVLGLITGMLSAFVAFVYDMVIVPIWNVVAMLANFFGNVFNDPIASIKLLFLDLATNILDIANTIAGVIDALFGTNSQSQINSWIGALDKTKNEIKDASDYEEIMPLLENWDVRQAAKQGYEFGDAMSQNISKAIDNNDFFSKFGDAIGLDDEGNTALKTTSSDNLLGEEDIQLLLDVATRDFKLDYQQITPEITITFGDVHETADVDGIVEIISSELEDALQNDLTMEVATAW